MKYRFSHKFRPPPYTKFHPINAKLWNRVTKDKRDNSIGQCFIRDDISCVHSHRANKVKLSRMHYLRNWSNYNQRQGDRWLVQWVWNIKRALPVKSYSMAASVFIEFRTEGKNNQPDGTISLFQASSSYEIMQMLSNIIGQIWMLLKFWEMCRAMSGVKWQIKCSMKILIQKIHQFYLAN